MSQKLENQMEDSRGSFCLHLGTMWRLEMGSKLQGALGRGNVLMLSCNISQGLPVSFHLHKTQMQAY